MSWQELYPEGSTVFIGRDSYTAKHNPFFPGVDLYRGELCAMTVCPQYLPQVVTGIRYP